MSIRSEIETKLKTWAALQVPAVPVSYEKVPFTKPPTGSYLQIFFLDSVIVNPDVSAAQERETGVFQINVCVPVGTGSKIIDTLVAALRTLFPVIPKTGTVSIERPAQRSKAYDRDDGFNVTPLSFSFRQER